MKFVLLLSVLLFVLSCSHWGHKKKYWKMMDANADEKISKKEWTTSSDKKFADMDLNSDGFITFEEKKQWKKNKKHKKD